MDKITIAYIAAGGAVVGVVLTTLGQIIAALIQRGAAKRDLLFKAGIDSAIKAWEVLAIENRGPAYVKFGVSVRIIGSIMLMDLARRGRLKKKNANKEIEEVHRIMELVDAADRKSLMNE